MADTEVDRSKLLSQIKEAYGRVIYTYTAHYKIAERTKKWKEMLNRTEIIITAVSSVGLLSGLVTSETALKLVGGFSSAISLVITLYTRNGILEKIIKEHTEAANNLWLVREKYQSLIIDADGMETTRIQTVRAELTHEVDNINRQYSGTDPCSYCSARKAIKNDEEQYSAPEEAEQFLPHN